MTIAEPAGGARLARIRLIYDAMVAGDSEAAMAGAADAIEWRNPDDAIEPGTRQGRASFAEALASLFAEFSFQRFEILGSAGLGDAVAARVRVVATGRSSGAPFEAVFGHVFRFDGEQVVAFEWARDADAALEAVGLDRWPDGLSAPEP